MFANAPDGRAEDASEPATGCALHDPCPATQIRPKDEPELSASRDAHRSLQVYAQGVKRPLNVALGWNLPDWLLTGGPVALIVVEGAGAIAVKPQSNGRAAAIFAALAISAGALLLRHRKPLVVLLIVLLAAIAVDYPPVTALPTLLAVFTVAEYENRSKVIAAAAVTALVVTLTPVVHAVGSGLLPEVLSRLVPVGLAVAVGLYLRARADYIIGLQERAERLERERELQARQAVAEERVRIARELHDVVAHNVSLMVVQAQAMAATGGDPEALGRLASIGREALAEMHRMLGVLRVHDGGAPAREPQPGVRDLEALVARAQEAGLRTNLTVDGEPRELPPGVDLSAYRIVQEAITNVIRHASAERAEVNLSYSPDAVDVIVVDDGVGWEATRNGAEEGHGLVGMRERVALFGGTFEAGLGPNGRGHQVRASLPFG
jgi:signal transduction histidine kinase